MKIKTLLLAAVSLILTHPLISVNILPPVLAQTDPDERTNSNIYKKAIPAVVTIETTEKQGSGSIVTESIILTNEHVVSGLTKAVIITNDNKRYEGEVIATDKVNDLALIKIMGNQRFPIEIKLADPKSIQVGQKVYAIGSPTGRAGTLTTGILNRIDSNNNNNLEIDAKLNHGSSGGPLLNSQAELIGVNKGILKIDPGVGVATNVSIAKAFLDNNRNNNPNNKNPNRPDTSDKEPNLPNNPPRIYSFNQISLGANIDKFTFTIKSVKPGTLASLAGLRPGDRIVSVNYVKLNKLSQLNDALNEPKHYTAILTIKRGNKLVNIRIKI